MTIGWFIITIIVYSINRNKRNNKLTLEIINEIRELHKIGKYTQKELSLNFHITNKYLYKIINNKIWKN